MMNRETIETRIFGTSQEELAEAAAILREGGLVAFPTETVYGLGADALNPSAVAKVYAAKGRPSDNPMIVHIARASDIGQLTPRLDPRMIKLIENFWPGPLTLVVKKKDNVPMVTTGGLDTVAVRMPDDSVALELIRLAVRSGLYPVFEIFDGKRYAINVEPDFSDEALEMYLSLQARFQRSGITTASLRPEIDRHWQELRALSGRIVPARRIA